MNPISYEAGAESGPEVSWVRFDQLVPNPDQPRRLFDPKSLAALAANIALHGLLHPILVRPRSQEQVGWEIVAGEQRWRAVETLGWGTVPVLIVQADDINAFVMALCENERRRKLLPSERAAAALHLLGLGWSRAQLEEQLGWSRGQVQRYLLLSRYPDLWPQADKSGSLHDTLREALQRRRLNSAKLGVAPVPTLPPPPDWLSSSEPLVDDSPPSLSAKGKRPWGEDHGDTDRAVETTGWWDADNEDGPSSPPAPSGSQRADAPHDDAERSPRRSRSEPPSSGGGHATLVVGGSAVTASDFVLQCTNLANALHSPSFAPWWSFLAVSEQDRLSSALQSVVEGIIAQGMVGSQG